MYCSFLLLLLLLDYLFSVLFNYRLQHKPTFFLLENVKGFEGSVAHDILIETLKKCSYNFQEFLLSPANFGIPNSRLRYYVIAKLESSKLSFPFENKVVNTFLLYFSFN